MLRTKITILVGNFGKICSHLKGGNLHYSEPANSNTHTERKRVEYVRRLILGWDEAELLNLVVNSELIFTAIRCMVSEGELSPENIEVLFFREDGVTEALRMDRDGRIPNWPEGFFDEYSKLLAKLIRWRKKEPLSPVDAGSVDSQKDTAVLSSG